MPGEEAPPVPEPEVLEILGRLSRLEVAVNEAVQIARCVHEHLGIVHEEPELELHDANPNGKSKAGS